MIRIESSKKGFTLYFKDAPVLRHSHSSACVTVGTGSGDYKISHGSFTIKEHVLRYRTAKDFLITENGADFAVIEFPAVATLTCKTVKGNLELFVSPYTPGSNRIKIRIAAEKEHIYGCGEQYSKLDLKGTKLPIWVQEQGVGRGHDLITLLADLHSKSGGTWYTTYFAQPTFISSKNYFVHVDSTAYAVFDFKKTLYSELYIWGIPEKIIFGKQPSAPETVKALTDILGRQPMLPDWTYNGVWLGVQGGTDIVNKKLTDAVNAGVQVGALWAQDWEGRRVTAFGKQLMWNWMYDPELYKGLPAYLEELNKKGIKYLGYINPFLAIGTTDAEDGPTPDNFLYNEAKAKGYLAKKADGSNYYVYITTFPAALVDLTNPDAFEWIKGVIKKNMIDLGLAGWMADFGEYMPTDAVLHSGDAEMAHNSYPVLWAKANREAVEESGKIGEVTFFMRAGYSGTSRYATSVWAGDQLVNFSMDDGLATVIPAGISMGLMGIGAFHSDIGGYTTVAWLKRSKECFMRWAEQAAFTPIMHTHEGNRPDANWQFNSDAETISHFASMTKVYTHLAEYHKAIMKEYTENGLPPIRHPYLHYENDEVLHTLKYQYLYGRDLLVAPVYKPGKTSWKVYLPDDQWVHLWSGKSYSKGWHRVNAPLGEPPVFYRSSSRYVKLFDCAKEICSCSIKK